MWTLKACAPQLNRYTIMEEILQHSIHNKKGVYYFLTKYLVWIGFCIVVAVIFWDPIFFGKDIATRDAILLLSSGIFFIVSQFLSSRIFPHRIRLYNQKIEFDGPWKIGKQAIQFTNIKSISYNDDVMMIMPRWPGFNKVVIFNSIDPDRKIRNEVLRVSQEFTAIQIIENARI